MARLQGGTRGILAAINAGRLDPLSPYLPEKRRIMYRETQAERRATMKRDAHRRKAFARRFPF